ncbi:unnamed protein product [Cuscuta epithymum]|uniref:Dynamin-related protein 4C-like n=1 Tax=Cuscuta epithymum TaxID=186058 RepID=A0AAV0FWP2_9ASTE|nr:unnamed protein product [Cuscuta epithymum]
MASCAPIMSSYDGRIRPLLDCIDKLRSLNISQEGIQLPTIVVVGDQSSGKSSVLESLAGISLPRAQGMSTRVPLIMRLQNQPDPDSPPEIHLEFGGKIVPTDEAQIVDAITSATDEIAGRGKGVSRTPLTLTVKKCGVPDLTMVDLPGITRVPVRGQPHDIYEQIRDMILEYITSKESIILNVLSATVDFPTCESIRMSQKVDKTGERTLAVVTKADIAPQGLLEKVTANEVQIGLGYVCVRNRIGSESYEDARIEEAKIFDTHPLLSNIDKSMVSIPVLADKLVSIQERIISKCLPDIVKKINDKLESNLAELNRLPPTLTSMSEVLAVLVRVLNSTKNSLSKLLLTADFEEYLGETDMHGIAKIMEMVNGGTTVLKSENLENKGGKGFLMDEISELEMGGLSNFLPHRAFIYMLQKRLNQISPLLVKLVGDIWMYIGTVVTNVLLLHSKNCPQIQSCTTRAAENLIAKKKSGSMSWVMEMIGMEKLGNYTCNPEYFATYDTLMLKQGQLTESGFEIAEIGAGAIEVGHLKSYRPDVVRQAFDIKMRMVAYWKIVRMRIVDGMVLHILFTCQKLVDKEIEDEVIKDLTGHGGIEKMLEESALDAEKRQCLLKSIELLEESRDVVAKMMDRITLTNE